MLGWGRSALCSRETPESGSTARCLGAGTFPSPFHLCGALAVHGLLRLSPGLAPVSEKSHHGLLEPALSQDSPGLTWGNSSRALRDRGDLRHPLTPFQPAGRGTQNACQRVGRTSFARAARPGCSRKRGLREAKGARQPLPARDPHSHSHPAPPLIGCRPRASGDGETPKGEGPAASWRAEQGLEPASLTSP